MFYQKWLLSFLFVFQFAILSFCYGAEVKPIEVEVNQIEVEKFLSTIASTEEKEWKSLDSLLKQNFPHLMFFGSATEVLSYLNKTVLSSDNTKLIKLYQRAVRNHDALSVEKADPFTFYYKHYQPPSFFVPHINLTIDIQEASVLVTSDLSIKRNSKESSLILDGKEHDVKEVFINNVLIPKEQYKVTPHELILLEVPEDKYFQVKVKSEIDPFSNTALEGMYQCGQWLTTQCESEGARRIFFTLDRPDVLSRITTTIIADKERYPYRLSNGDLISEVQEKDGRWTITWNDPFPKPSYLFACVLGRFSMLSSQFTTKSSKNVELQIYVEPGKESRAHYALFALKKAMEFDEVLFDREYDLSCLKMVGIPDFNSGAMENKGLMIFNDIRLLVDDQSGTDRTHREVAAVVGHEYFHNWSGNRVTVRNWFEIALKEAFTDLRAMMFTEWLFGPGFIRPKAVLALRESQFPEEISEKGHPIIVESYVDAHSIYDATTYTKGREVFRTLKNYIDQLVPDGFRKMQNLYFSTYDGQAVTFRELLSAANEILRSVGQDLSQFERWFHQQGTPILRAEMRYNSLEHMTEILITQACPHPKTGVKQEPLEIPFSIELLGKNGNVIRPQFSCVLEHEKTIFKIPSSELATPVFMHGFSAPVILKYDYTLEDLATIIKYSNDSFTRWDAGQTYSLHAIKEMMERIKANPTLELKAKNGEAVFADLQQLYSQALKSPDLSPLAKAQLLELPSLRAIAQSLDCYDFERLEEIRQLFIQQLALNAKSALKKLLQEYPAPAKYEPQPEQMQVRELRNVCLSLLVLVDEKYQKLAYEQYQTATNFEDAVSAFHLCLKIGNPYKETVIADFYNKWKDDKAVFNFWLASQSSLHECTVADLIKLESAQGYDSKNPNHVRSIFRSYIANLRCYHSSTGEGYRIITDKIVEIASFNPFLAHNYIAVPAFIDFEKLPCKQQALLASELERMRSKEIPAQTKDLVEKMLDWYNKKH